MQASKDTPVAPVALVALGANLPLGARGPAETVTLALDRLAAVAAGPVHRSRLWRTPAYPPGAGPDFVNAAAAVPWVGKAQALLEALHRIEAALGRTRARRWEARIADLDLIALGDAVRPDAETWARWAGLPPARAAEETPDRLILPHPRLAERGFVLVPLAEVAPDWVHPVTGRSVAEMRAALAPGATAGIAPIAAP